MSLFRIHILGASGSGTSTLGAALARDLQCQHIDVDQFFWMPTNPPFQLIRPLSQRQTLLGEALASYPSWALSGSLCGWGDLFIPQFDVVVFNWVPPAVRLARLRDRERIRYGDAILPSGAMHQQHQDFVNWAAAYDDGDLNIRSRKLHEHWLARLPCPVIRLEGDKSTDAQARLVRDYLAG